MDRRKFITASLTLSAAPLLSEQALAAKAATQAGGNALDPLVDKVAQAALLMQRFS